MSVMYQMYNLLKDESGMDDPGQVCEEICNKKTTLIENRARMNETKHRGHVSSLVNSKL